MAEAQETRWFRYVRNQKMPEPMIVSVSYVEINKKINLYVLLYLTLWS